MKSLKNLKDFDLSVVEQSKIYGKNLPLAPCPEGEVWTFRQVGHTLVVSCEPA